MKPTPKPAHRFALLPALLLAAACLITTHPALAQDYTFTTLAGRASISSADGRGSAARFNNPSSVAVDAAGNVYVADSRNNTIRKVTPAGVVTTLAGLAGSTGSTNGTGSAARFAYQLKLASGEAPMLTVVERFAARKEARSMAVGRRRWGT